ncbi:hypothetical protein [Streptacidiphilus neutrinimicus]|uniref:hypothetical protein n=1 Tax=Streptacidiphilus neutrinimicus TaxID=105420 RepID=UPI000AC9D558|nr:hypothetical protein [Streptacidiphilus neutrinimicus]
MIRTRGGLREALVGSAPTLALVLLLSGCVGGDGAPAPVGDPDPGHRLLRSIEPVLTAIPPGAHVTQRDTVEPRWDSCDGVRSTFGWAPPTVDVAFDYAGAAGSADRVVAHVRSAMQALGWTYDPAWSGRGQWQWRRAAPGGQAQAQLLGGADDRPSRWSLQASVPAATHPVKGC